MVQQRNIQRPQSAWDWNAAVYSGSAASLSFPVLWFLFIRVVGWQCIAVQLRTRTHCPSAVCLINKYRALVGWLTGKIEVLGEKLASAPLRPHRSHMECCRGNTRLGSKNPTAWNMARPSLFARVSFTVLVEATGQFCDWPRRHMLSWFFCVLRANVPYSPIKMRTTCFILFCK
jgi:hypothetical protein